MKIYNPAGAQILDIQADDKSYQYKALGEISSLTLYFSSVSFVEIPLGSYLEFLGETFYLEDPENFKKLGTRNFEYTLLLESAWARSRRFKIRNIVDGRLKFDLTATPADHLKLIVDNMNLRDPGWSVGNCIDATEKLVSYNHIYCKDALQAIADAFSTEWEVIGKVIHLKRVEYYKADPLVLSYGKGNGFKPGLGRMNLSGSRPVERLYVQGGERNIDYSKYGSKLLLLPKSQQLVYEGRTYLSDADGLSISRADKAIVFNNEDSLDLSHIYPSRVGEVTSVEVIDAGNHFYDIIDNLIPEDLDYVECLVAGETLTIIFQSGILAGREFEVKYIHADRKFEIVPQEIDGQTMPNTTFKPVVGDKYAVFGMALPDAYVCDNVSKTGASWDMFREAAKYYYEHEEQQFSFTGDLDGIYAKANWLVIGGKIKPGSHVLFSDTQFLQGGALVRIVSVKHFVNNPYSPVVELSNSPAGGTVANDLKKIDANEVVTELYHKEALKFTKRRFRDAQETMKLLESAFDNYSGSINPLTVQTMAMLVGDESLQFRFVDDKVTPAAVNHNVVYDQATKVLTSPAGIIQHMTLGISAISPSHGVAEYKYWNIALYESPALVESEKSYYLYAKVSKAAQTGVFLLSETAIGIEAVAGYYHLLVGVLNSEDIDGERSYVDLYGYTEILPGRITAEKFISPDGNTFVDLLQGIIQGNFKFTTGVDVKTSIDNAQQSADEAYAYAQEIQVGGRNLLRNGNFSNGSAYWDQIQSIVVDPLFGNMAHCVLTAANVYSTQSISSLLGKSGQFTWSFILKKITPCNIAFGIVIYYTDSSWTDYTWHAHEIFDLGNGYYKYYQSGYSDPNKTIAQIDVRIWTINNQSCEYQFGLVKLESGNKPTDWTPAPEDIDEATSYLRAAIQNNTTVQGGLLATSLIRLGAINQAGTWIEKAGINGIPGNDSTPRLWTGGTLAQAIARVAGDLNGAKTVITEGGKIFGREVELYGTLATAPTGERIVLDQASKAIIIYDANNVPKTIISSSAIPALNVLLAGNSAQVDAAVQAEAISINESITDTKYSATLTLAATSNNYTITTPPIEMGCSATSEGGPTYRAGSSCVASLVLPDNSEIQLGAISANTEGNPAVAVTIPSKQFSAMLPGSYRLKLVASASSNNGYAEADATIRIVAPNNILKGESIVNVSRIHKDGMFLITDASHYHYISPTREVIKNDEILGFGVLAAAMISSVGVVTNLFNTLSGVTAEGNGLYTITHNLGHVNYSIQITPDSMSNSSASVESRGLNSCSVRLRLSGTGTNMPFHIVLLGKA